jgi:molecular chaperone HscB
MSDISNTDIQTDFFTFFSLPRKLQLDTALLEKNFYLLSRKLHPDRFAAKPLAEQRRF